MKNELAKLAHDTFVASLYRKEHRTCWEELSSVSTAAWEDVIFAVEKAIEDKHWWNKLLIFLRLRK